MPTIIETVRETATFNERQYHRIVHTVRETAILDDATVDKVFGLLRETAVLHDAAYGTATTVEVVRDRAVLHDAASGFSRVIETVREVGVLDDRASDRPGNVVRERAVLNDAVTQVNTARTIVRERARVFGRALPTVFDRVRETAVLHDATSHTVRARTTVRETAQVRGAALDSANPISVVRERFSATERASAVVRHRVTVRERAFISGTAIPPPADTAWTANVQTWAMSRYTGFPYDSFTARYAAGASGLFMPGAETFTARIETGDCLLGSNQRKGVHEVYALGSHEAPLQVGVTADVRGLRYTGHYLQEARRADATRVVRCRPGQGFYSNTYRFSFESDQAFELHGVEVSLSVSQRRV